MEKNKYVILLYNKKNNQNVIKLYLQNNSFNSFLSSILFVINW